MGSVAFRHVASSCASGQTYVPCMDRWFLAYCATTEVPGAVAEILGHPGSLSSALDLGSPAPGCSLVYLHPAFIRVTVLTLLFQRLPVTS